MYSCFVSRITLFPVINAVKSAKTCARGPLTSTFSRVALLRKPSGVALTIVLSKGSRANSSLRTALMMEVVYAARYGCMIFEGGNGLLSPVRVS